MMVATAGVFQYGGINVECAPVEGAIKIAFHHYSAGSAAVLLVNATPQTAIEYHQKYVDLAFTYSCYWLHGAGSFDITVYYWIVGLNVLPVFVNSVFSC